MFLRCQCYKINRKRTKIFASIFDHVTTFDLTLVIPFVRCNIVASLLVFSTFSETLRQRLLRLEITTRRMHFEKISSFKILVYILRYFLVQPPRLFAHLSQRGTSFRIPSTHISTVYTTIASRRLLNHCFLYKDTFNSAKKKGRERKEEEQEKEAVWLVWRVDHVQ